MGKPTLAEQIQFAQVGRGLTCFIFEEPPSTKELTQARAGLVRMPYARDPNQFETIIICHSREPRYSEVKAGDLLLRMERAA